MESIKDYFYKKKIALIGNSVILASQRYGYLIDSHDIVCRINKGPLACDVKTYGIRTDVLFYGNPGIILPEVPQVLSADVLYVLTYFKFENREQPKGKLHKLSRNWIEETKTKNGYPEKKKWPSNGSVSLFFLLEQEPHHISLFGFDWKRNPTFYTVDEKKDTRHKYDIEEQIVRNLEKVKIYE